jgi:hypothetical protein
MRKLIKPRVNPKFGEGMGVRFEGGDFAVDPRDSGKPQSVEAEVGSHIPDGISWFGAAAAEHLYQVHLVHAPPIGGAGM